MCAGIAKFQSRRIHDGREKAFVFRKHDWFHSDYYHRKGRIHQIGNLGGRLLLSRLFVNRDFFLNAIFLGNAPRLGHFVFVNLSIQSTNLLTYARTRTHGYLKIFIEETFIRDFTSFYRAIRIIL